MPSGRGWGLRAGAAGVVLVVAGLVVLLSRASREAAFGWFAYAPLSEQQLDGFVAVNGARVLGALLVAGGLVLVALAVGARAAKDGVRPRSLRGVGVVGGLALVAGLVGQLAPRILVAIGDEAAISTTDALLPGQLVGLAVALVGLLLLAGVLGARAAVRQRG